MWIMFGTPFAHLCQIVKRASAILGKFNGRNVPCACTHSEISKFESPTDVRFKDFVRQLNEVIQNALEKNFPLQSKDNIQDAGLTDHEGTCESTKSSATSLW